MKSKYTLVGAAVTVATALSFVWTVPAWSQSDQSEDKKADSGGWEDSGNEKEKEEPPRFALHGRFSLGSEWLNGNHNSSKFTEYRDLPNGAYLGSFDIVGESGNLKRFVKFKVKDLLQEDELLQLRLGAYGRQDLLFKVDHLPHYLSNTGRMVYQESSRGNFTLADQVQTDLKKIATTDINLTTPGTQIDTAAFGAMVTGLASPVDLAVQRQTNTVRYTANLASKLAVTTTYGDMDQKGARPFGTNFFFTNSNELPVPVDYHTREWKTRVDYTAKRGAAALEWRDSAFTNRVKAVSWDNPIQPTDSATAAARGQASQAPDSQAQDLSLFGVWNVSKDATLSGALSRGTWKQNEAFLPYTVNTALTPPALPAQSLNGKIATSLTDLSLNMTPRANLSARAYYRRYANNNETPQLTFPGYVQTDMTVTSVPIENEPVGYTQTNRGIEALLTPRPRLSLKLTAEEESWDREDREVSETKENSLGISADYRLSSWLLGGASVRKLQRRMRSAYVGAAAQLPGLRKYDEADRDRGETSLSLQATPAGGKWDATFTYNRYRDFYPNSDYGFVYDRNQSITLDVGYSISDRLSVFAGYARERINSAMDSRYRPATGAPPVTVDDPANDWSTSPEDNEKTYWFGLKTTLVPEKLDMRIMVSASSSHASTSSAGVPGGAAEGEPPPLPDTKNTWFNPSVTLNYRVRSDLTAVLGYHLERYRETDFAQDAMQPYMPTSDALTSTWLGAQQPNYTAHIITFELRHAF